MNLEEPVKVPYDEAQGIVDELVEEGKMQEFYFESMVPHDESPENYPVSIDLNETLVEGEDTTVIEYKLTFADGGLVSGHTDQNSDLYDQFEQVLE